MTKMGIDREQVGRDTPTPCYFAKSAQSEENKRFAEFSLVRKSAKSAEEHEKKGDGLYQRS
jgi:hypothetical protein